MYFLSTNSWSVNLVQSPSANVHIAQLGRPAWKNGDERKIHFAFFFFFWQQITELWQHARIDGHVLFVLVRSRLWPGGEWCLQNVLRRQISWFVLPPLGDCSLNRKQAHADWWDNGEWTNYEKSFSRDEFFAFSPRKCFVLPNEFVVLLIQLISCVALRCYEICHEIYEHFSFGFFALFFFFSLKLEIQISRERKNIRD